MAVYGCIGLGAMGMGMAQSMVRAGLETWGFDVNPETVQKFVNAGGKGATSVAEVAKKADVIFVVVVNMSQLSEVLLSGGKVLQPGHPNTTVVGCSTIKPGDAEVIASILADKGIRYVDAPISGGAVKAMKGEITMMVSGTPEALAHAREGMEAVAAKIYTMGHRVGQGSAMKTVHQLLAGVHIAVAAEAMAFGIRMGLDPDTVYEVVTNAAGNSWMFENRMAHVLKADYTPLSAVDIFVKDLGLVLDTTHKFTFPAPLAAAAHQQFLNASAAGFGREDDSAVIKIFPGIRLPEKDNV